ncbi:MAG: ice-binding family protein [Bacteroidota bacterium]
MKQHLLYIFLATILLMLPKLSVAQAPVLGTVADFVLFSSSGAVTNTGTTRLTGNVGTNLGASTGFGNIDGVMHDQDAASLQGSTDLTFAYNQLNATVPTLFPAASLGNGQTLNAGVYSIATAATINLALNLDAQGDPNAVFIFQINGSLSTGVAAKINLLNGAQACNVFWKVEGFVNMAANTTMRGTIIANNGNITTSAGDTLEGRAASTNGILSVNNLMAHLPLGCGVPALSGPANPPLGTTQCFALFSATDPVTNSGTTTVTGDIGTDIGTTTGYNPASVIGTIHPIPDGVTAQAAIDFNGAYNYLNTLPYDIDLLFPAQFGNSLVLTPHVYRLNGATTLTDTLFLNAQGNPNAVFVIQVNGAFGAVASSIVVLQNGALAENVYWKINGITNINNNSIFKGTIVSQDDINLFPGTDLDGRALTGSGAINTNTVSVITPTNCAPNTVIEPVDQTVCTGGTVSFAVVAGGVGLTYQWRRGNVNLVDGGNISGATTPILTINPATALDADNDYNVIINGSFEPDDTSNFVSLTILFPPSIITQPVDMTVCSGDSAAFTVAATGSNLTYQWRLGAVPIINGGAVSGANNDTLIINPATAVNAATNYNVVVTGSCAPVAVSNDVTLTINTAPVITTQPTDQTVCEGNSVSLSTVATGSGLTYQWRKGATNVTDGGQISGATTSTLTINPAAFTHSATDYYVVVSGACQPNDTSNMVSLQVDTLTNITTVPVDITACAGDSIAFVVDADGSNLSYQWRRGLINVVDGGNISGANNDTLIFDPVNALNAANNYNVVVTGNCITTVTSLDVALTVNTAPVITTQPTDQTVCEGSSVTFSTVASGSGLTYQWRKGATNVTDGGPISGATTASLTINPVAFSDAATDYYVVVSGACQPNDTSNMVSLQVDTLTNITTVPVDITACAGDSIAFVVGAEGSNLTYQWRRGLTNVVDGGPVSGANNDTLIINPATPLYAGNNYNVVVSGSCITTVTSIDVALTINTAPIITTQPTDQAVCEGSSVTFSTVASGSGLTYQWRKGATNVTDGGSVSGATTSALTINPTVFSDEATDYYVVVSGACQPNDTSVMVSLQVDSTTSITTIPVDITACAGDSVAFIVGATGSNLTYQWRRGLTNMIDAGPVSGSNNDTLIINPATTLYAANNYNVVVTGTCSPAITSADVELTINTAPQITTQPTDQTVCEGNSVTFSTVASGSNLTYQWRKGSTNITNGGAVSGATTANLTINPTAFSDIATDYNVIVSGSCPSNDTSSMASLQVDTLAVIVTQPTDVIACTGDSITFEVVAEGTNLSYQWRRGLINLVDAGSVSGSTTATLTINPVTLADDATNYNVIITGGCVSPLISDDVELDATDCFNDLSVVKTASTMEPTIGTIMIFKIVASNIGGNATNVTVTDILQSGYTYITSTATAGTYDEVTGVWTIGVMTDSTSETLYIKVEVNENGDYDNTAVIAGNGDSSPGNNTSTVVPVPVNLHTPEGFSPNGDGVNDTYVIRGISNYPLNHFQVFNRWGTLVYEADNYQNTWDGTSDSGVNVGGDVLPVGTYFYVLDLGEGSEHKKGTIYLNK